MVLLYVVSYIYPMMLYSCIRYYNPQFQHSSFLCKYQLEYISTGRLQLFDFLLGNNVLLSYFMEVGHLSCGPVVVLWSVIRLYPGVMGR